MANMTFKTNLVPNTNLGYSLGSSTLKWNVYGDLTGNASTATKATNDSSGNNIVNTYLTKAAGVTAISWDSTNKKLTRTINGTSADVVQFATDTGISLTAAAGSLTIKNTGATGVKGNAESPYRTGNVNLTQANIIGSTAIGSATKPIYWSGSSFSAISSYEGNSATASNATNDSSGRQFQNTYVGLAAHFTISASSTNTVDLNDYITTGSYTVPNSVSVQYVSNMPSDYSSSLGGNQAFRLDVYALISTNGASSTNGYRMQEIIPYNSNIYKWTRRLNWVSSSSSWNYGGWVRQELINTAHTSFTWTNGSTAGPTGSLAGDSQHGAVSFPAIPAATSSISGIVTTGNQTFAGVKTFNSTPIIYNASSISSKSPARILFTNYQTDNNLTNSTASISTYDDGDTSTYGQNMVIQSGGNMIIGSGESPGAVYSAAIKDIIANSNNTRVGANTCQFTESSENLILTSDGNITFLTNCDTVANRNLSYLNTSGYFYATKVYGAVWNDYAEYRSTAPEHNQPGRCVREVGDGTLIPTTKRLERGCEIVSDTFGFAIGETDECQTPIASNGRVLAYLFEDRELARERIGWPVCSGPQGTVSIMTEEEEEKYPSRIIGTISEVPDYEEWGSGNVKVNGRIWIRIK